MTYQTPAINVEHNLRRKSQVLANMKTLEQSPSVKRPSNKIPLVANFSQAANRFSANWCQIHKYRQIEPADPDGARNVISNTDFDFAIVLRDPVVEWIFTSILGVFGNC